MTKEQLNNLEKDLKTIIDDNFHPRQQDLMNICLREDVFELIKFAKKIQEAFYNPPPDHNYFYPNYMSGYQDCFNDLKREIYE